MQIENKFQFKEPKERMSHQYTNELELKTLLIRVKNAQRCVAVGSRPNLVVGNSTYKNRLIEKYIKWFIDIGNKKYPREMVDKKTAVRAHLKERAIRLALDTEIDKRSYENFGQILLLMIKNILRKPQFSGYTYKDDFYSDAIHKILKYLHNFKYNMISERSGTAVNAFSYISQIILNSVLHIINLKNAEMKKIKNYISSEVNHNGGIHLTDWSITRKSVYNLEESLNPQVHNIENIEISMYDELLKLNEYIESFRTKNVPVVLYYPSTYCISFEEYDLIKPMINKVSLIRKLS